ncbi:MAG: hypothetical protein ACLU99_06315 [Alphaproteobacteria bacterium]
MTPATILNMLQAKYRYRDWFGGNNFIHGSDNKKKVRKTFINCWE